MVYNRGSALAQNDERLRRFESELHAQGLGGHWEMLWVDELLPYRWSWADITGALQRSIDILGVGAADDPNDRRTVHLVNPTLADLRRTSRTIQAAVQLVLPGESGEAHRHSQNAMRFVVEASEDMYTTVNGEMFRMSAGDLVLTPNWSWHDHTNASPGQATWLDILDVNLTIDLGAHFKDTWTEGVVQPVVRDHGHTERRTRTVRPQTVLTDDGAVPYAYPWAETAATLDEMVTHGEVDANEGACVEFVHPLTGGAAFPSMQCRMHLIPPGGTTRPVRRTGSTLYHVFRGQGTTTVGTGHFEPIRRTPSRASEDVTLDWDEGDLLLVPSWRWQSHVNHGDDSVLLFSVTDAPALRSLGWFREERA